MKKIKKIVKRLDLLVILEYNVRTKRESYSLFVQMDGFQPQDIGYSKKMRVFEGQIRAYCRFIMS